MAPTRRLASPLELDPTGLALLVLLPLVVAVVLVVLFSFVALVVEAVFVVLAAFLFRGRWLVEATTPGPPPARTERRVRGWRRSKQAAEEMARELQTDSA